MQYSTLALAALAGIAQAVNVQVVNVGWNPVNNATGLKFWPEKITAEAGSMVQFQFWTGSHTVTQSTFDGVCSPMAEGVDSGSMPVEASADKFEIPTYTVMINDTKPLWFYCKTGPHCQEGMAMVVNENTAGNATRSLENYKALAAGESVDSGSGSGSGSGGSTGGSEGGSSGGDATGEVSAPGADGTPVAGGDAAGSTGESNVPAGAATYGIPSTLLLVLGSAFVLL